MQISHRRGMQISTGVPILHGNLRTSIQTFGKLYIFRVKTNSKMLKPQTDSMDRIEMTHSGFSLILLMEPNS